MAKKDAPCNVNVLNPKGRSTSLKTKKVPEGYEAVLSPWDTGLHKVTIDYDSVEVPGSPFSVEVFKINMAAIIVKGLEKRKLLQNQSMFHS